MGAWIEIKMEHNLEHNLEHVAPFMGAWIEILGLLLMRSSLACRTLHGCVD